MQFHALEYTFHAVDYPSHALDCPFHALECLFRLAMAHSTTSTAHSTLSNAYSGSRLPFHALECLFPALSNAQFPALERPSPALESQLLDHPCKSVCVCRIYALVTAVV